MDASPEKPDALTRLTPLGARGSLAAIVAGLVACFFAFAYFMVYWRNADMDLIVVHNALAINDGREQIYFDHPAHLLIWATASWLKLLHALGLVKHTALATLPASSDVAAFDAALTEAVRAGRLLALVLGVAAVAGFAALMRRIVDDWRIVALATFALAFSGGIAIHIGRLRSEMIAAMLTVAALLILVPAARRASAWRPALLGLAAFLCVAALSSKVHAILLIGAFPVLLLPFGGAGSESTAQWRSFATSRLYLAALLAAAILSLTAAMPLIREGLDPRSAALIGMTPFIKLPFGVISAAILAWLAAGMIVFARVWRVSAPETAGALLAVAAGAALGLCVLWIGHHPFNAAAVMNPLERMLSWVTYAGVIRSDALGSSLVGDIGLVLSRYTYILAPSSRPTVFLVWLIVPAAVYAWRRRDRQLALQALILVAVAFAIDTLGMRRGLKAEYWIFTDPLIILAGALLLERLAPFHRHRFALPIGLVLIAAHLVVSQSGPARTAMLKRPPTPICEWNHYYLPLIPLHFCPP